MIWTFEKVSGFNTCEYNEWKIYARSGKFLDTESETWLLDEKIRKRKNMFLVLSACKWLLIIQLYDYATQSIFIIFTKNLMHVSEKQDENHHTLVLWATMVKTFLRVILFSSYFLCQLITESSSCLSLHARFSFLSILLLILICKCQNSTPNLSKSNINPTGARFLSVYFLVICPECISMQDTMHFAILYLWFGEQ